MHGKDLHAGKDIPGPDCRSRWHCETRSVDSVDHFRGGSAMRVANRVTVSAFSLLLALVAGTSVLAATDPLAPVGVGTPPPEAPIKPVTETIHGVKVTDNYRYMEKLDPATSKKPPQPMSNPPCQSAIYLLKPPSATSRSIYTTARSWVSPA